MTPERAAPRRSVQPVWSRVERAETLVDHPRGPAERGAWPEPSAREVPAAIDRALASGVPAVVNVAVDPDV